MMHHLLTIPREIRDIIYTFVTCEEIISTNNPADNDYPRIIVHDAPVWRLLLVCTQTHDEYRQSKVFIVNLRATACTVESTLWSMSWSPFQCAMSQLYRHIKFRPSAMDLLRRVDHLTILDANNIPRFLFGDQNVSPSMIMFTFMESIAPLSTVKIAPFHYSLQRRGTTLNTTPNTNIKDLEPGIFEIGNLKLVQATFGFRAEAVPMDKRAIVLDGCETLEVTEKCRVHFPHRPTAGFTYRLDGRPVDLWCSKELAAAFPLDLESIKGIQNVEPALVEAARCIGENITSWENYVFREGAMHAEVAGEEKATPT